MNIYIICPVRNANHKPARDYARTLTNDGHSVHFPPDDVDQSDPTGRGICKQHLAAMCSADEVHVIWDVLSYGSHFDLGMAYALDKKIVGVESVWPDDAGKSYWKAVICV